MICLFYPVFVNFEHWGDTARSTVTSFKVISDEVQYFSLEGTLTPSVFVFSALKDIQVAKLFARCYAALSPKHHAGELLIAAGFYYTHICCMRLYAVSEKIKTQIQAILPQK